MTHQETMPCITRYPHNPILSRNDVPYDANLVFNAGIAHYQGRYVMVFRNDYGDFQSTGLLEGTNLGIAYSDDGITWEVSPKPLLTLEDAQLLAGARYRNKAPDVVHRFYDPRLTILDGRCCLCFAVDTSHGVRGGIAATDDFEHFELLSLSVPDNRNMVLFPERIGGEYVRLERPFPVYGRGEAEAFDVWLARSPDLRFWGEQDLVLGVEDVPFSNRKIGPAAPPVRTERGWLTLFHAVDYDEARGKNGWEETWKKRYTIGLMLLDLEDPARRIGLCPDPIMVPEAPYETDEGFRTHVLFPGGMVLEESGEVKIYYGAADTVECLATAHVDDLLSLVC